MSQSDKTINQTSIHSTALVESEEIGEGTQVWAYTHIAEGARVGKHCNIGDHCYIESGVVLGDGVIIKNGNMLFKGVTIQDGVFVGPHVFFTNDLYPRSRWLPQMQWRDDEAAWLVSTLVKRGASLGSGAIILAGITVGEYAMVGAGAVVTRDVAKYALVKGNPARQAGWVCRCGQPLGFDGRVSVCAWCGLAFRQAEGFVELLDDHKEQHG
jgi:acetyltransferase-like isoleucine patch superfamily enzyme